MKKIIARQIDCEWFDWEAYLDEASLADDNIWIGGNRDFIDLNKDLRSEAVNLLNDCEYDVGTCWDDFNEEDENYEDEVYEAQIEVVGNYTGIKDRDKLEKLLELIEDYRHNDFNTDSELQLHCDVLEILKGVKFNYCTLRGCCQSDWIYCIHPEGTAKEWLDYIEAVYFGTGTEFAISCGEVELDDYRDDDGDLDVEEMFDAVEVYHDYTAAYSDDDVKEFIADSANVSVDDVAVFTISNTRRYIKYDYKML